MEVPEWIKFLLFYYSVRRKNQKRRLSYEDQHGLRHWSIGIIGEKITIEFGNMMLTNRHFNVFFRIRSMQSGDRWVVGNLLTWCHFYILLCWR